MPLHETQVGVDPGKEAQCAVGPREFPASCASRLGPVPTHSSLRGMGQRGSKHRGTGHWEFLVSHASMLGSVWAFPAFGDAPLEITEWVILTFPVYREYLGHISTSRESQADTLGA